MKTKKRKVTITHNQLLEMLSLLEWSIGWQKDLVRCEVAEFLGEREGAQHLHAAPAQRRVLIARERVERLVVVVVGVERPEVQLHGSLSLHRPPRLGTL